ncbi:MAG: helix-turn-helix domain-containing protein [Polyangiaceae bacterium]|nr:helix-turn-helix domain-containing protein [Polyangiaceae bacterium]
MDDADIDELGGRLAQNIRSLREARGLTQQQMAKSSGLPRATWANLESGSSNPTLAVMMRVATALSVPFEELLMRPSPAARHYPKDSLPVRDKQGVIVRSLLPHKVPNMVLERLELAAGVRMTGTPHTPGTREYLACEKGTIELTASGERFILAAGDVVVFRGDQKHGYANPGTVTSVGYSVVVLRPVPT